LQIEDGLGLRLLSSICNPLSHAPPTRSGRSGTVGVLYNQMITASNGTGNKTMMVTNYNAGANNATVGGSLWSNQLLMHFETLLALLGLNEKQSSIH
jgi:hypothetical protein